MYYFKTQEEAIALFDKLAPASKEHRIVFIVVNKAAEIKPLQKDMAILLQRFKLELKKDSIRIKGTTENQAQSIIFITEEDQKRGKLKGRAKSSIIHI